MKTLEMAYLGPPFPQHGHLMCCGFLSTITSMEIKMYLKFLLAVSAVDCWCNDTCWFWNIICWWKKKI